MQLALRSGSYKNLAVMVKVERKDRNHWHLSIIKLASTRDIG